MASLGFFGAITRVGEDGSLSGGRSRGVLICQILQITFNAETPGLGQSTVMYQEEGDIVESQVSSFNC